MTTRYKDKHIPIATYIPTDVNDEDLQDHQSSQSDESGDSSRRFHLYKRRWVILLMYAFAAFLNAAIFVTFSPVAQEMSTFYGVSQSKIDILTMLYIISFLPGLLLSVFLSRAYGIASSFKVGSLLMAIGAVIRLVSYFVSSNAHPTLWYNCLWIGQFLCGLAQPLLTTLSAQIAQMWFSKREQIFGLFIGSLANPLGIALGALFTRNRILNSKSVSDGLDVVLLTHTLGCGLTLIAAIVFFEDGPPTPPTKAQAIQLATQPKVQKTDNMTYPQFVLSILRPLARDTVSLFKDNNYNFSQLCIAFSLGMYLFNILAALPAKLISVCSAYDTSHMLTYVVLFGLIGCVVYSVLLEITRKFRLLLKIGYILGCSSFLAFLWLLSSKISDNELTAIFIAMGIFMLPLLPLSLENAQELCYPQSPQLVNSVLLFFGQLPSAVALFVSQILLDLDDYVECKNPATSSFGIFVMILLATIVTLILIYNGDTKRSDANNLASGDYQLLGDGNNNGIGDDDDDGFNGLGGIHNNDDDELNIDLNLTSATDLDFDDIGGSNNSRPSSGAYGRSNKVTGYQQPSGQELGVLQNDTSIDNNLLLSTGSGGSTNINNVMIAEDIDPIEIQ